jgi:proliferating cell nuclear antigen
LKTKVSYYIIYNCLYILESKKTCEFEISLINIDQEHIGIPDTKYNSIVTLSSLEFGKICRELNSINETVNIEISKSYVKFYVNNESIGGGFTLEPNDSEDADKQCIIKNDDTLNLAFALRYLNMFAKASCLGQQVTLYISKEYPLLAEYKLAELGVLKYYLAPRIAEDEKEN